MIRNGDKVSVYFEYTDAEHDVQVISQPYGPGDSWKLERQDGTQVNVMHFTKMVKTGDAR